MRGRAFTACANCRRASTAVLLLAGLCACADAPAQETDELVIKGSEVIDPQERISGGAVTGVGFGDTKQTGEVALDELWAYFGGLSFDATGNYRLAFIISAIMSLIAFACSILIKEKRHVATPKR